MTDDAPFIEAWDGPLTEEEWARLPPRDKGRRNTASLRRKVEAMERVANGGDADGQAAGMPRNRAELRRLSVPDERFWTWSDRLVDDPGGKNAALLVRFEQAVAAISGPKKRGERGLRHAFDERGRVVGALERQVCQLLESNVRLRAELAAARARRGKRA